MIKTYKDLRLLKTFEERFEYLRVGGSVGDSTFGFDRYLNQSLYSSSEWKKTRRDIIIRDKGCDLGIEDFEIYDIIVIHHINPLSIENIEDGDECIFDPNNLICTSDSTHRAIHYGARLRTHNIFKARRKGDTTLWTVS